jgi:hypothetical protein
MVVVGEDDEVAHFQHMVEMLYDLVDGRQLPVISSVFLLARVEFLGEENEGLPGVSDALLKYGFHGGRGGVCDECTWRRSGCASRVARDKLALHTSKALWSSGVQMMGWEPLTLGPERTS